MTDRERKKQIDKWTAAGVKHAMWCTVVGCPCRWHPVSAESDNASWAAAEDHRVYKAAHRND
jgi:hypothetical protein